MKALIAIIAILCWVGVAAGQARTAERLVDRPFSSLTPSAPNGSVGHCFNCRRQLGACQLAGVGETPVGSDAIKLGGTWFCSSHSAGIGTGDVVGPASSSDGELPLYDGTTGKLLKRSNSLSGVAFLTSGVVSALGTTGTGDIVRSANPTITGVNASTIFGSGVVPTARVVSGAITNERCLRVSNVGTIEVAANDCGTGSGGTPGGVSGNIVYNESGAFGGASNTTYTSATGVLELDQKVNGNDTLFSLRATDSAPTGNFLRFRNAANSTDLFTVNIGGAVFSASPVTLKTNSAPATPAAGNTIIWTDLTDKNLKAQDDAGNVSITLRPITCSGTDKISAISSAGVVTCTADQGGAGTGVITLNTLTASDQSFVPVDDTNIDLQISSVTSTHTFTVAWVGSLAKARQHASTVYNDQANTWTTGAQSFAAASSLTVPSAAGASPTASGQAAYDTTSNTWEGGVNGTNRTFAFTAGSQSFSDKTLDNSNVATLRDTNFTIVDGTDVTKAIQFEVTNVASSTTRFITVPNANTVTVQPSTLTTDQVVTHIDSSGVQQKAQLAFSQLTGSILATQGGTNQTAVNQGDLLFGSATNTWSRLAKSTTATHALLNTGASNNPQWGQVPLATGVTGVLPVANWSPLTTKGDLLTHDGATSVRLGAGSNGFVLKANSATATGLEWGAVSATAGGSSGQVQWNNGGSLAGISGATTDGTVTTFSAGNIIIGNQSAQPTATLGRLYVDSDDSKLYFAFDGSSYGEVYVAGKSLVNLAQHGTDPTADSVTGILPPEATEHTINSQASTSYTLVDGDRGKLIAQSNAGATAYTLPNAAGAGFDAGWYVAIQNRGAGTVTITPTTSTIDGAASLALTQNQGVWIFSDGTNYFTQRGIGGGGGGTPGGSDTQVQFNDGGAFGGDSGFTYNKTTDTASAAAWLTTGSGAGYIELLEGTAPTVVANRLTFAAPTDVAASGLLYILPADTPTNGEQLTANISGTTVTLSWDAAGAGGSGDSVSVNGSATTDANFINTAASGTVASVTWSLNTTPAPDEVSATIGTASLTEAGILTTGTQGIAGIKILGHTAALGRLGQTFEITTSANYGGAAINTFSTTAAEAGILDFNRSKSATKGTHTVVAADDVLGHVTFRGSDGTDFESAAGIIAAVDGTPGNNDMPGRLSFFTTPDASTTSVERWRINNAGHLLAATDNAVDIGATGATRPRDIFVAGSLNAQATGAGYLQLTEGTAPSLVANTVQHVAASDAPAGGSAYIWGAAAGSGILRVANSSGTMTVTQDAGVSHLASSTSADLRGVLSDESGTGVALFAGGDIGAGTATTPAANDNDTSIATTAYVQTELTAYASDSKTLTNTQLDAEATGNVLTSTSKVFLPAAGCQNTTAASFWDLPTATPAVAACVTGTNTQKGVLDFADTTGGFSAQNTFVLPSDFTGTVDARILWTTTATTGNVEWSLSTICTAVDATETDDPAFNTASTVVTAAPGVANRVQTSSITSVAITGCAANELMHVRIFRDGNDAQDTIAATARLIGVELTLRRAQ